MEPKQYKKLVSITRKKQTQRNRETKQWFPLGRRKRAGERWGQGVRSTDYDV